ncbi:MAG TPA: hypothetical protein VH857_10685 [Actinomycetes bacterium]|jgi:hypothetical protein|nr:hypothetical protein [Actinomycetes bacterium]
MFRTRQLLSTLLGALLLVVVAGPAFAQPGPLDDGPTGSGGSTPVTTGSDTSVWLYAGYAAAVLAAVLLIAVVAVTIDRHAHQHAPHPA